jgi:hypothetical protein
VVYSEPISSCSALSKLIFGKGAALGVGGVIYGAITTLLVGKYTLESRSPKLTMWITIVAAAGGASFGIVRALEKT